MVQWIHHDLVTGGRRWDVMCLIELLCLERRPRGCFKVFFFPLLLVTHIPAPSPLLLFNPSFSLGPSLTSLQCGGSTCSAETRRRSRELHPSSHVTPLILSTSLSSSFHLSVSLPLLLFLRTRKWQTRSNFAYFYFLDFKSNFSVWNLIQWVT